MKITTGVDARKVRKEILDLSQEAFAKRLGVERTYISGVERQESLTFFQRIAYTAMAKYGIDFAPKFIKQKKD